MCENIRVVRYFSCMKHLSLSLKKKKSVDYYKENEMKLWKVHSFKNSWMRLHEEVTGKSCMKKVAWKTCTKELHEKLYEKLHESVWNCLNQCISKK